MQACHVLVSLNMFLFGLTFGRIRLQIFDFSTRFQSNAATMLIDSNELGAAGTARVVVTRVGDALQAKPLPTVGLFEASQACINWLGSFPSSPSAIFTSTCLLRNLFGLRGLELIEVSCIASIVPTCWKVMRRFATCTQTQTAPLEPMRSSVWSVEEKICSRSAKV